MNVAAYTVLKNQLILNHDNEKTILVEQISHKATQLLTSILYEYNLMRPTILKKHQWVMDQVMMTKKNPLEIDLNKLSKHINSAQSRLLYHINITNKALIIKNSSFPQELNFDLEFAKPTFDRHFHEKRVGCSPPLYEKSTARFLTYTDAYIKKGDDPFSGVLQIGYHYQDRQKEILDIKKTIVHYPTVKNVKAFTVGSDGFIHDIILHEYNTYKPSLSEMVGRINDGKKILEVLNGDPYLEKVADKDGHYKSIFIVSKSIFFNDTKILFSILLDESAFQKRLHDLNILMVLIFILGFLVIGVVYIIRTKETRLSQQNIFIQNSMHEIKIPLSVITLNNDLRRVKMGSDIYGVEIDNALKVLKNSYEDMSFSLNHKNIDYPCSLFLLSDVLQKRVSYFNSLAVSHEKLLNVTIKSGCIVNMSEVELIRLIDNNISNAIKYSDERSTITIVLDENIMTFHNYGEPIKNTQTVFKRYVRENSVKGGHGLGLYIVKSVVDKYAISMHLKSRQTEGTTFSYIFRCHENDT